MLYFKDFSLTSDSQFLAMQYDNKTRQQEVFGNFPAGWSWIMLVTAGGNKDHISLYFFDDGIGYIITNFLPQLH